MALNRQSPQEQLLNKISDHSFGCDFVFRPDKWIGGRAQQKSDEPADLIWATKDCIVFMFMQEKKARDSIRGNLTQYEKAQNHNLKQAIGRLREWRIGKPIVGRNAFQEFLLPSDFSGHVVVLSIVKCVDVFGELHPIEGKLKQFGVTLCATLPQYLIEELTGAGGGIIDLLAHAIHIRSLYSAQRPPFDMSGLAAIAINTAAQQAGPTSENHPQSLDSLREAIQLLMSMRGHGAPGSTRFPYFFNDVPLADLYKMAAAISTQIEADRERLNSKAQIVSRMIVMPLTYYDFPIIIGPIFVDSPDVAKKAGDLTDAWLGNPPTGARMGAPLFIYDTVIGNGAFVYDEKTERKTHLTWILDNYVSAIIPKV